MKNLLNSCHLAVGKRTAAANRIIGTLGLFEIHDTQQWNQQAHRARTFSLFVSGATRLTDKNVTPLRNCKNPELCYTVRLQYKI